jgi:hypothetical protein
LKKDFGSDVANEARAIGDFDFDLKWRPGDLESVNAALAPYGLQLVEQA